MEKTFRKRFCSNETFHMFDEDKYRHSLYEYDILKKYMMYNWYDKMGYFIVSCEYM